MLTSPRHSLIATSRNSARKGHVAAACSGLAHLALLACLPVAAQAAGNPAPSVGQAASAALLPALAGPAVVSAPPLAAASAPRSVARPLPPTGVPPAQRDVARTTGSWVALDAGHRPGEGSRSASGVVEHNFNLRFAAQVEADLRKRGLRVVRLPSTLSAAERARRAQGAGLLVSIHHEGGTARASIKPMNAPDPVPGSPGGVMDVAMRVHANGTRNVFDTGYAVFVGSRNSTALPCARAVALALQGTGRPFSEHHGQLLPGEGHAWIDRSLGVLRHANQPLLMAATSPALMIDVAHIARPSEEKLARDPAWVRAQAAAVATGVQRCLAAGA